VLRGGRVGWVEVRNPTLRKRVWWKTVEMARGGQGLGPLLGYASLKPNLRWIVEDPASGESGMGWVELRNPILWKRVCGDGQSAVGGQGLGPLLGYASLKPNLRWIVEDPASGESGRGWVEARNQILWERVCGDGQSAVGGQGLGPLLGYASLKPNHHGLSMNCRGRLHLACLIYWNRPFRECAGFFWQCRISLSR
jgi:hypothetical protein